ncbi:putative abhydrolase domain-containing protein [Abeliophyllum distichum]|uniref:Abhydrolase domain-containing protein n=1 Tax=Abeliophyllum distichum TaxID=126358 RepID=A0ABD1THQ5_9LAMI
MLSEAWVYRLASECIREWDAIASSPNVPKDFEGVRSGSNSGRSKWMESDGGGHVLMVPPLFRHGDASSRISNRIPADEVAEEERQGGGVGMRVYDDPEPDLNVPSVYGIASVYVIASPLPRCELSRENIDVLRSIYEADSKSRSYSFILNRQRCLVELGLVASKAEMDQGRRPRPTLAKLAKQRPRTLVPGSVEDTSQRKAIEDLSRVGNKDVAGVSNVIEVDDAPEVEVPLSRKRKAKSAETGASQVRGGAVDVDNTVCGAPPLQRTLAVNQSGEVVLEGPSRPTPTLGSGDGDHFDSKRRLRELIGAPGARIPDDALRSVPFYPSMGAQAVKKYFTPKWEEFSSHGELEDVLEASLASAMQMKVAAEALEAANRDKRRLLEEAKSRDEEISGLRKELADAEKGKKEAEDGKKEVEAKLANAEAYFVANFHNTEAYSNFADYFSRVGQQEVLTALRNDHPEFDVKNLEARFPPPDAEGEEDS